MDDTFESLRIVCSSYITEVVVVSGEKRKTGYFAVKIPGGQLKREEWVTRMTELIHDSGEDAILEAIRAWSVEHCAWLHTKAEVDLYALGLHSHRVFENKDWAGYRAFRAKHKNLLPTRGGEPG